MPLVCMLLWIRLVLVTEISNIFEVILVWKYFRPQQNESKASDERLEENVTISYSLQ